MATTTAPILTISEQQHFGDYGFELDPHMNYFQNIIPKVRRHATTTRNQHRDQTQTSSSSSSSSFLRFKFHKPNINKGKIKKKRSAGPRSWWKTAIQFWKWAKEGKTKPDARHLPRSAPVPAPLYVTESCYDSSRAPCRRKSGGLWRSASSLVAAEMGRGIEMPYLSLGVDDGGNHSPAVGSDPPAFPIYMVT